MRLWSVTTTIRNTERIRSFLKVLKELEGEVWNDENQKKFQVTLIQRKIYGFAEPQFEKTLTGKQIKYLYAAKFTYKQAEEILESKNYVGGGEMRGRQSFNALEKLGLAYINDEKQIKITSFGESFLAENYDVGDFFFKNLIKWQYPNPDLNKYSAKDGYNIKPLIATFHLIKKVNALCAENSLKEKGVSKTEFALFFTTLSNYNIDSISRKLIDFRKIYGSKKNKAEKDAYAARVF